MERAFKSLKETAKKYALPTFLLGAAVFVWHKNALASLLLGGGGLYALHRARNSKEGSSHSSAHQETAHESVAHQEEKGRFRVFRSSSERLAAAQER